MELWWNSQIGCTILALAEQTSRCLLWIKREKRAKFARKYSLPNGASVDVHNRVFR